MRRAALSVAVQRQFDVGARGGGRNWEAGIDIYTLLILYIT